MLQESNGDGLIFQNTREPTQAIIIAAALASLIVGVALGLLLTWVIWPVEFKNADPADLREKGRKLFAGPVDFIWAAAKIDGLPPMGPTEIAFAGRSNV